jgi:hypothetical protein
MAYGADKFTVTNAAATQIVTGAAGQAVLLRVRGNPVLIGPSNITADGTAATDGFRVDPEDKIVEIPVTAAANDLYARALPNRTAQVEVLTKAGA